MSWDGLFGEHGLCSASRTRQEAPTTIFALLLGGQADVLGERHAIPSKRVLNLGLSEKELDSDENLRRDRSDQEVKIT